MKYMDYNNKIVSLTLKNGDLYEGICKVTPDSFNLSEYGRKEYGFQLRNYLFFESDIQKISFPVLPEDGCLAAEEALLYRFSVMHSFSEHLVRFEDNELPDKYDNNFFAYSGQPSDEEFRQAVNYQKSRGDAFIKLAGRMPLKDRFGLMPSVSLTMKLESDPAEWKKTVRPVFKTPSLEELEELELSQYGPVYGESFARRNIQRLYSELSYHGAYLNGELTASCYTFLFNDHLLLDGLLVDPDFRRRGIATALLAHIAQMAEKKVLFLHADADDFPKTLYEKLGFREIARTFEYLCSDLVMMNL